MYGWQHCFCRQAYGEVVVLPHRYVGRLRYGALDGEGEGCGRFKVVVGVHVVAMTPSPLSSGMFRPFVLRGRGCACCACS